MTRYKRTYELPDRFDGLYAEEDLAHWAGPVKTWQAPDCIKCRGKGERMWVRQVKYEGDPKVRIPHPTDGNEPEGAKHIATEPLLGKLNTVLEKFEVPCERCCGSCEEPAIPWEDVR